MKTQYINSISYGDSLNRAFGGYNDTTKAGENEFKDMMNMSSDKYPFAATRKHREIIKALVQGGDIDGIHSHDHPLVLSANSAYHNGAVRAVPAIIDGVTSVAMGAFIVLPTIKNVYDTENDEFKRMDYVKQLSGNHNVTMYPCDENGTKVMKNVMNIPSSSMSGTKGELVFYSNGSKGHIYRCDGINWTEIEGYTVITIAGVELDIPSKVKAKIEGNCASGAEGWSYDFNDVYEIVSVKENTFIIKGVLKGWQAGGNIRGQYIGLNSGAGWKFTVDAPELDGVCCRDNRLWGYSNANKEIRASKLGSYSEWNSYQGIATDSYTATVASMGDFTACAAWNSYTIFFKEDRIVRVSGTKPANYTIVEVLCDGVKAGSQNSVVEINGVLYYHSPHGIMAYDGSYPVKVSEGIDKEWSEVKACTADNKYYCNVKENGKYYTYCYDTKAGMWHKQDEMQARQMFSHKGAAFLLEEETRLIYKFTTGEVVASDFGQKVTQNDEGSFQYMVETEDMFLGVINRKKCVDLKLRYKNITGKAVVYVSYDGGDWEEVFRIDEADETVKIIPLKDVYFDYMRVKIAGNGEFIMKALSYSVREGTDVQFA